MDISVSLKMPFGRRATVLPNTGVESMALFNPLPPGFLLAHHTYKGVSVRTETPKSKSPTIGLGTTRCVTLNSYLSPYADRLAHFLSCLLAASILRVASHSRFLLHLLQAKIRHCLHSKLYCGRL